MKRSVQILLLFTCLAPLFAGAREETMEERKRRIMHKYLRERTTITYSEIAVPEARTEVEEEVLASEKFKQPEVDFQRQEPGMAMPPPAPRPAPRAESSNWLLSEAPELDDPYANPFARKDSKDEPKKKADWTNWGAERDSSPYADTQRESRFNWRGSGTSFEQQSGGYDPSRQGIFDPRDPRSPYAEDTQQGFQQQGWQAPGPYDGLDLSREKTFDSSFNQRRLRSPFMRETETPATRSFGSGTQQQQQRGGYTPYRNPYQTQHEQRRQQWGGYTSEPKQEYQRKDTFQQWKDRNPTPFDPTSDDAFINEMMPKTRR